MICITGTATADSVIDLGAVPNGYDLSDSGLNNVGQAFFSTIQYNPLDYVTSGKTFLYSNGKTTDIGNMGGAVTQGAAMNDLGEIVGVASVYGKAGSYPFLYSGGKFTEIGGPNGSIGNANAINNKGQVVGEFLGAFGASRPFLYSQNGVRNLAPVPGTTENLPVAINDAGQIAFQVEIPNSYLWYTAAVLRTGSQNSFIILDPNYLTDGALDVSSPRAMNSNGQVVGYAVMPCTCKYPPQTGMLYSGGKVTPIDPPADEAGLSMTYSINDSGEILGEYRDLSRSYFFLYSDGSLADLSSLMPAGWSSEYFLQINNSAQILGSGTFDGEEHVFILDTATPEPASLALAFVGVIVFVTMRRWSRARRLWAILEILLRDRRQACLLDRDGSYTHLGAHDSSQTESLGAHRELMDLARR
jgi:probable HAF family extracellular repeat protein